MRVFFTREKRVISTFLFNFREEPECQPGKVDFGRKKGDVLDEKKELTFIV